MLATQIILIFGYLFLTIYWWNRIFNYSVHKINISTYMSVLLKCLRYIGSSLPLIYNIILRMYLVCALFFVCVAKSSFGKKGRVSENDFLMDSNFLLYISKSYYKIFSIVPNRTLRNALKFQGPLENTQ